MTVADRLAEILEPIAAGFRSLNIPEPITHWGHPLMMGIVIFAMGSTVVYSGWKSRLASDEVVISSNRELHRKLAPAMTLFLALGYTGGVLSLVMQHHEILASPHFWTGSLAVLLLLLNGGLAFFGIKGKALGVRTVHAYIGGAIAIVLLVHTALGLTLGVSL
jgi:hypothetical protein